MASYDEIEDIISRFPDFQRKVFYKGFLISDKVINMTNYSLLKNWNIHKIGIYTILYHPECSFYNLQQGELFFFMIGDAINPISHEIDEMKILQSLAACYKVSEREYYGKISELTGIFVTGIIKDNQLFFMNDAVAMQTVYYGINEGKCFVSSHTNLISLFTNLTENKYIKSLINYKHYHYFGVELPGDLSLYNDIFRVQSNFIYFVEDSSIEFKRIFPLEPVKACTSEKEYSVCIDNISKILEDTMSCVREKWKDEAWLSLTGGRDSTTSLASFHNSFDSLQCFSYITRDGERYDAEAAEKIAKFVGTNHKTIVINTEAFSANEIESVRTIIEYNYGNIGKISKLDVIRQLYFFHNPLFQVEIKSWVDEIGRARYHKRYLKKTFPETPKPRYLSTIYKPFTYQGILLRKTDFAFLEYLKKYYDDKVFSNIPWWDLIYWEYSWGALEGLSVTYEHRFSHDIFIPFNNRFLLEKMLSVPLDKRIDDRIQKDVISKLCPRILSSGIHVKDFGWDRKREIAERIYWEINTKFRIYLNP